MAIIPELFLRAVTSVGIRTKNDEIKWIGSGFFLLKVVDDAGNGKPFLVTNKHVVESHDSIVLMFNDENNHEVIYADAPLLDDGKNICYFHENKIIDIAVVPLNGNFFNDNHLPFYAFNIDEHTMTSKKLLGSGVEEGTFIYMLGFPMELVNNNSTLPICRLGCIARIKESQIAETANYLVDLQNFPGNSGSPIITRPEIISIQGTPRLNRSVLAGIVHSYIPYREELQSRQTGLVVELRTENSGIALVHPVEYIREIIDHILANQDHDKA